MPISAAWLAEVPKGPYKYAQVYTLRGYKAGTATADYADNEIIFSILPGVFPTDSQPSKALSSYIIVRNLGAVDIIFSFDGTNTHGRVKAGQEQRYKRRELGMVVKSTGANSDYEVECW